MHTKVDDYRVEKKIWDSESAWKTELTKVCFWVFAGISFLHRNLARYPMSKIIKNLNSPKIDERQCLELSFSRWFRIWYFFFYSVIVDFSMHKIHFKVFFGIFEQYVLGDRPEGRFFATSFHRIFIALGNCYWYCKNSSGSTVNSEEPRYTILQLGVLNTFGWSLYKSKQIFVEKRASLSYSIKRNESAMFIWCESKVKLGQSS